MSDSVPESEIQVIRSAILGFIEEMDQDKRMVEQQIREKTENVRSELLNSGASQFSYQEVDDLSRQYRDEFLNFYRNTIHLKIIAGASSKIRSALHQGFLDAEIVQQEWLDGFESLQEQINKYQGIANRAEELESELKGTYARQTDIDTLHSTLEERDQLIQEKDQEIMNLNEGLARMEDQVNTMGQNMLENSMTIEELQEAINERDEEITRLRTQISESAGNTEEIEVLKQQLRDAQDRERELQQQVSTASTDLVNQLQDNLEQTREQVLELRRDLVQKNEELHALKLEYDEQDLKTKQQDERIKELRIEVKTLETKNESLEQEVFDLNRKNNELETTTSEKEEQLTRLSQQLDSAQTELEDVKDQLASYEGKVAMSAEEQEKINRQLEEMKSNIQRYQDSIDYIRSLLGNDVKFRSIMMLSSMDKPVRIDDLANAINAPESLVQRAIIELNAEEMINTSREGRYLFCSIDKSLDPPMLLTT